MDLPEPLAPSRATRSPCAICQREAAQRGNAVVVEARVLQLEECGIVGLPSHPHGETPGQPEKPPARDSPTFSCESRRESGRRREIRATAWRDRLRCSTQYSCSAARPAVRAAMRRCSAGFKHAYRAASPRFQHLACRLDQQKDVAMGHGQHRDGLLGQAESTQSFQHVRPGRTQDQQGGERDGSLHAQDQQPAVRNPCSVIVRNPSVATDRRA